MKRIKGSNKNYLQVKKPILAGISVFLIFILVGGLIVWQRYHLIKSNREREMSNIMDLVEENLERSLKSSYSVALSLALLIDDDGTTNHFEEVAPKLLEANTNIDAVELVPGGVISKVYPLEENREALNYDILKDSTRNAEAYKAIEKRKMFFAGPLKLKQGGMAVVGRLPVFIKNKFWGFSAVIIKLRHLLKQSGIFDFAANKYKFQFSKIDPDTGSEIFFLTGFNSSDEAYSEKVNLPDGDWKIYIAPIYPKSDFEGLFPLSAFILFVSIGMGAASTRLFQKPERLEALVKSQAGKLYKSEKKFRTIFNQAPVGMAIMDTKTGGFKEVNKCFEEMIGYEKEELKTLNFREVSYQDDIKENALYMEKLYKGEIDGYSLEKRAVRKDGAIMWINLTVSPLWEAGEEPNSHIAIIEDVTDKKEGELQLNKSYQMVMEQNRRLVNFSYIISHDLRSHSSNIQSILGLYSETELEEERSTYIDLLSKVAGSLNQTLHHLNEVVSIQSNLDLKREPLKVKFYLNRTLDLMEMEIKKKNARLINEVPEEMVVTFNPAYMESILLNFISNALRYKHQDRDPVIRVTGYESKGKWVLEIADNGMGIDLERHGKKLFGLHKTFSKMSDSRGVGLFITKNQVEAMGGSIDVESKLGEGTSFKVIFG